MHCIATLCIEFLNASQNLCRSLLSLFHSIFETFFFFFLGLNSRMKVHVCDISNFKLPSAATFRYYMLPLLRSGRRVRSWLECFVAKAMRKLTDLKSNHSQYIWCHHPKWKHFSRFTYVIHFSPTRFKVEFCYMDTINKDAGWTLLCASWENALKIYFEKNQLKHTDCFHLISFSRVTQHKIEQRPFWFKSNADISITKSSL